MSSDFWVLYIEGNGNPLQCSCLENPRDRGACWAAIYGVAQSWTRLKQLSSSSSSSIHKKSTKVIYLRCLVFVISSYILMFPYVGFFPSGKIPIYLVPLLPLWNSISEREVVSQAIALSAFPR